MSTSEKRSVGRDNTGAGNQSSGGTGAHAKNTREHAAEDNKAKGREGREAGLRNSDRETPKGGDAGGRQGSGTANR